jgi:cell division GTPase FtsZ
VMIVFEFDESFASFDGRIALVGIGSMGQKVVAAAETDELEAELFTAPARPSGDSPWLLTHVYSHQATTTDGSREQNHAAMIFVAGELNGDLLPAMRHVVPNLPETTQAVVVLACMPPSYAAHAIRRAAVQEIEDLTAAGATVIVIDSDQALRDLRQADPLGAYRDRVASHMHQALTSIVDLLVVTGEVNVDFADVVFVLRSGSAGFFASGAGEGTNRAILAADRALAVADMFPAAKAGAQGCVINITGGLDLRIDEVTTIASMIQEAAGDDAEIVFGAVHSPSVSGSVLVSTIWTGYHPTALGYDRGLSFLAAQPEPTARLPFGRRRPSSSAIRVFLASPSDVADERESAKSVIDELNLQNTGRWGTFLELVRWETHAMPAMGPAQEIVTRTTKFTDIDIFVGVLWSRLGTPTAAADSGTVEEFNEAYSSWSKCGRPWIAFYFCDRPVQFGGVGRAQQYLGVAQFRESFPDKGIYFTYTTVSQFEQLLSRHLPRIVEDILDKRAV